MYKNNDENNKEVARGAGMYNERPDSNAICESLVSKLTEKNDNESKSNIKKAPQYQNKKEPEDDSDSDDSEDTDDDSGWSRAPTLSGPRKTPRAFEKSDHLYEEELKTESFEESDAWETWDPEEYPHEDSVTLKDTNNTKP